MSWRSAPHNLHVDKHRISDFWDTSLDSILRNLGTCTILFAGVNTDQCVMFTLTDVNFLGYGCVLLEDCCATSSPPFYTEAWMWMKHQEVLRLCHGQRATADRAGRLIRTAPIWRRGPSTGFRTSFRDGR